MCFFLYCYWCFSGFIPEGRIYTHYWAAVGEHGLSWDPLFALVITIMPLREEKSKAEI